MTDTTRPDFCLDHTMLRVKDLERSLDFYTRILGMTVHRKTEYPEGRIWGSNFASPFKCR